MIDEADARLAEWAREVGSGVPVSFNLPASDAADKGISLYLMEVTPEASPRGRTPPLQASLRYLVTTWATSPQEAHKLLGELMFAAMENPDFEVESGGPPPELWSALRLTPQPSFLLNLPVRKARAPVSARLVKSPLVIRDAAMVSMRGVVLGPGDMPIAGARVEVPSLQLVAVSDSKGRFTIHGIPDQPDTTPLLIRAKGRELALAAQRPASSDEALVIRFGPFED